MSSTSATPLGPGSRGPAVRALQQQLRRLGATIDDPPGRFGPATEAALRAFQRRRPWGAQDALATPALLEALSRAEREEEGERQLRALAAGGGGLAAEALGRCPALVAALQRALAALGLHPDGPAIDGVPGPALAAGLRRFHRLAGLPGPAPAGLGATTAAALQRCRWLPAHTAAWTPAAARRRFAAEARRLGASDAHLPLLDRGADHSPWRDGLAAAPLPPPSARPVAPGPGPFAPYPPLGVAPPIVPLGLPDLGSEIGQACIGLGRHGAHGLETLWLGRDALTPLECLSSTKLVPMLNVLARLGARLPAEPDGAVVRPWGSAAIGLDFAQVLCEVVSYAGSLGSSNALAALLNQLEGERAAWIRGCTGGPPPLFGGRYGEPAPIRWPQLRRRADDAVLLPFGAPAATGNAVSVYDLTRLISLLGWHRLLGPPQRLRGLTPAGARLAARALVGDPARYLDAAFASLGLVRRVEPPLILSKLGYGDSALVYCAFLHVRDHPEGAGSAGVERSLALTLRVPKGQGNREAVRADLAMAEAVTTVLAHALAIAGSLPP
ncbi:MAG: peptidoglycan-binding domain-containing protein [Synechococcaceae cyanobacterium]|nr:peptidoglycan-binding domain-containing protein [Synechococcaceae cyanobacterium]